VPQKIGDLSENAKADEPYTVDTSAYIAAPISTRWAGY
jgi:hypothetical protein